MVGWRTYLVFTMLSIRGIIHTQSALFVSLTSISYSIPTRALSEIHKVIFNNPEGEIQRIIEYY